MRIWADVYSNQDVKIAAGVRLSSASVSKELDNAGSFSLTFTLSDQQMFDLFTLERRVRLYIEEDNKTRLFGTGVLRKRNIPDKTKVTFSGPDSLDALARKSTLLGLSFNNAAMSSAVATLVSLANWSATVDSDAIVNGRFEGSSVLKALIQLVKQKGIHLREGIDPNTIEVGAFGEAATLRAVHPGTITTELDQDTLVIIDNLRQTSSSQEVVNWIVPLGGGDGSAAVTLEESSHTIPSIVANGSTLKYLSNQESIDAYGQIERLLKFPEIVPISTSTAARQLAADALYDYAQSWLTKNSVVLETYSMTLQKCRAVIRPGDMIRVVYKDFIETDAGGFAPVDLNEDMWVMKVTQNVGDKGLQMTLDIATIDRLPVDDETIIADTVDAITVSTINPKPNFNQSNFFYAYDIDSTHPFTIPLVITDATLSLTRALMTIKSRPFRANTRGATPHYHLTARVNDGTTPGVFAVRTWTFVEQSTGNLIHASISTDAGATPRFIDSQPNGISTLEYGIFDDTVYPESVDIVVDGQTVATGLGTHLSAIDTVIDITGFLNEAPGGLQSEHSIDFTCDSDQGKIEVQIELYTQIMPFKIGSGV